MKNLIPKGFTILFTDRYLDLYFNFKKRKLTTTGALKSNKMFVYIFILLNYIFSTFSNVDRKSVDALQMIGSLSLSCTNRA